MSAALQARRFDLRSVRSEKRRARLLLDAAPSMRIQVALNRPGCLSATGVYSTGFPRFRLSNQPRRSQRVLLRCRRPSATRSCMAVELERSGAEEGRSAERRAGPQSSYATGIADPTDRPTHDRRLDLRDAENRSRFAYFKTGSTSTERSFRRSYCGRPREGQREARSGTVLSWRSRCRRR